MVSIVRPLVERRRRRTWSRSFRHSEWHRLLHVGDAVCVIAATDKRLFFDNCELAVPATYGGLGLGLYITRQIIEAHHGKIDIASEPERGTLVSVLLPL